MAIRIFLISDYQLVVWSLVQLLEAQPQRFRLMATAATLTPSTVDAVVAASPDIVLLDIDMDPEGFLSLIPSLLSVTSQRKILLLTRMTDTHIQDRALMIGVCGVIGKNTAPDAVLTALSKVHEGQLWIDRDTTARVFGALKRNANGQAGAAPPNKLNTLTKREQQIVRLYACHSGDTGKAMASKLNISESTLRNHLTSIYEKIGVSNVYGLNAYAVQHGLGKPRAS